jgi:transcription-repair coupling factor (superfamily II helicase)
MYMKILQEAVLEEKGELLPKRSECTVDLALDGYLPETYVPYPAQRMELYRKIASVRTEEDAREITDELLDRYGDPPRSVANLFQVALLRSLAEELGCEKITQRAGTLQLQFSHGKEEALLLLGAVYASRLTLSLSGKPSLTLRPEEGVPVLNQCRTLLEHYREFLCSLSSANQES